MLSRHSDSRDQQATDAPCNKKMLDNSGYLSPMAEQQMNFHFQMPVHDYQLTSHSASQSGRASRPSSKSGNVTSRRSRSAVASSSSSSSGGSALTSRLQSSSSASSEQSSLLTSQRSKRHSAATVSWTDASTASSE